MLILKYENDMRLSVFMRLIVLFLLTNLPTFGQEIDWQNTIGGLREDWLTSIQQTTDKGYIVGGFSDSDIFADKTENSLGLEDYWIVKTDSLGNIQWQNTIGGSGYDNLNTLVQTLDGGYILGGFSLSSISGDKSENCIGERDFWIVKIDSIGFIQWQNTIGGSLDDYLTSIQQTLDHGYILGGCSSSGVSGDKIENNLGSRDFWVVKVDSIGNIQWQNTIGGDNLDQLNSIQQTTDGGYILGGHSESNISGDKTENSLGSSDYWIVKIDSVGVIQWQNTIGGSDYDQLSSMEQTIDGGYILGGFSWSSISGDKIENCVGSSGGVCGPDYWIVKTDGLGNIQWQNTIGGWGNDYLTTIRETPGGGFVFCGFSDSNIGGDKAENNVGQLDNWIVKADSLGNIQWQNTIGGSLNEDWNSLSLTDDGSIILGGCSYSNISGDKTENNMGLAIVRKDYWVIKLTESFSMIFGQVYADLNGNSVLDAGEPPLQAWKITELNTGRFSFTDQNGSYNLSVLDSGNFTLTPQLANWFSPLPISKAVSFTGINQTDSLNDFAFQPQGIFEDVCVTITPMGNFRSGFSASYAITFGNYGNSTVSPTVYFYPDSNITFQSATLTPTQIFPDSVIWNLPSLTPFQTGNIIVTVNVNLGLPIGTLINSSAHIEPYATDDNPSCNNSNWEVYTTGSFDPNDILVNEDTLTTTQLSSAPWLDYIIRFQNTGNDTAFTVKILNPIDTNKLNLSTIEFVYASHPVNLNWINYQRNMEFKFENILLPDSNTNEPLSHGFVRYRIQPKTNLSAGDSITNFAAIYFDFNEPVITNTAKTSIILPTGIASASPTHGKLHVFPNPSENTINISGIQLENGRAQLRLTDIYGKLIFEKTVTSTIADLETTNLPSGLYLLQSGASRATFMKQ
ncbi:MAG: T9SS type A sorting domain-containing protein [Bacteroidetes bacterium]|nr:T9SS type A sorting domain-containing protein [Bacteroidota bacterium]